MSVFSGGGATVPVQLVLDVDQYRKQLAAMHKDGVATGKEIGRAQEGGFGRAIKGALSLGISLAVLKKGFNAVNQSVERLAKLRGVGDPATSSFIKLRDSVSKLWDSFVLGVLKSQALQRFLAAVTETLVEVADSAKGLGREFDKFAKEHAEGVSVAVGVLAGLFKMLQLSFSEMKAVFQAAAGIIAVYYGRIIEFLGKLAQVTAAALDAVGLEKFAKKVDDVASSMKSFGSALAEEGGTKAAEAFDTLAKNYDTIIKTARKAMDDARTFLESDEFGVDEDAPGREGFFFTTAGDKIQEAMASIAKGVGDTWESAVGRLGNLFRDLAKDAVFTTKFIGAAMLEGLEDIARGAAALGTQVRAAFGEASAVAKAYAKIQLGIAAIENMVNAYEQWAKAADPDEAGASAMHLVSAGLFATAAGLAGARAAGVVGRGGSARSSNRIDTRAVRDSVSQPRTVVNLNIVGNLIDNRDYVRNELIPELRDFVADDGVLVASNAQTAQRLETGRFGS